GVRTAARSPAPTSTLAPGVRTAARSPAPTSTLAPRARTAVHAPAPACAVPPAAPPTACAAPLAAPPTAPPGCFSSPRAAATDQAIVNTTAIDANKTFMIYLPLCFCASNRRLPPPVTIPIHPGIASQAVCQHRPTERIA